MKPPTGRPRGSLREACVAEALRIIEEEGVERLSLREVARRLGVSHQAPYRHYPSRDHLLAEIVARAFASFAAHLDAHARSEDAYEDLGALGRAYLAYALAHPLQYRLMFGTPLPDPEAHPEMMARARHAFSLLRDALARLGIAADERDAMFVWATVHGLASLLETSAARTVGLPEGVRDALVPHTLARIGAALAGPLPGEAPTPAA